MVSYFSIEVAKLVTQPFCSKSSASNSSENGRIRGRKDDLRGPPGCP